MPLHRSSGNMYPWVTHTWSVLAGECPHHCSYCYVQAMQRRFKTKRYTGPISLVESELQRPLGRCNTIFVEHQSDLFSSGVSDLIVDRVLSHCRAYPTNTYVFQTKNPSRYMQWIGYLPGKLMIGTTLESNRLHPEVMRDSPSPVIRAMAMERLSKSRRAYAPRFITIEPVLDFDPGILAGWINCAAPAFVNIGADSKGSKLPEPDADKIHHLVALLKVYGIEIRQKTNLGRILGTLL